MSLWARPFIFALIALAPALASAQTTGKLTSASGAVFLKVEGGAEKPAKVNDTVPPGSILRTGPDGNCEVTFTDGSKLQLRPASQIALSATKRPAKKNSVMLFFGRMWSKVAKSASSDTNYEVSTTNAVAGVRGTEFETAVGDDGTARVRVTEGKVAVDSEEDPQEEIVDAGEEVEADEEGVDDETASKGDGGWNEWDAAKKERARTQGVSIIKAITKSVNSRKAKLEALHKHKKEVESHRAKAEKRAKAGDKSALEEVKKHNEELAEIANAIADLGDSTASQFGYADHLADLAADPKFAMVDRKTLEAEAKNLRKVKSQFDKMVKEGTDLSMKGMDSMLDDMGKGKGSMKNDGSAKDIFGD
jgi:hypothetical protein